MKVCPAPAVPSEIHGSNPVPPGSVEKTTLLPNAARCWMPIEPPNEVILVGGAGGPMAGGAESR